VSELVAIGSTLIEERKRIRRVLEQLPEHFTEVRDLLNELARTCARAVCTRLVDHLKIDG
jgi:hypothetical protein